MTRINFKNLPDKTTPRTAENLNKLNNLIIREEEPTTEEEVWLKESTGEIYTKSENKYKKFYVKIETKNLFTGFIIGIGLGTNNGEETQASGSATSNYIPVDFNKNQAYYLSGLNGNVQSMIYAYNLNYEFLGRTGGTRRTETILQSDSFTSGTPVGTGDIAYLRVIHYNSSDIVSDIKDLKVQLEIGDQATKYAPFFDKIVDVGSTIDTNWIKYANGLMIIQGKIGSSIIGGHQTLSNGMYVSDPITVVFPESFIDDNVHVQVNASRNAGDTTGVFNFTRNVIKDSFITWSGMLVSSTSTSWTRTYLAVGRWR